MCSQMDDPTQYDERPADRDDWDAQDLADALNRLTHERERQRMQERIRIVGWLFVVAFVVLFLLVARALA